jgi:hypothetical protein
MDAFRLVSFANQVLTRLDVANSADDRPQRRAIVG